MAEELTYTHYSVEDIERYLQGLMNAKEMHGLERAALQDPFLADAIEGYRYAEPMQSHRHLEEISAAILGEKQQAKIVALPVKANYWWRVAVVIGIVALAGGAFWYMQGNSLNKQQVMAMAPLKKSGQAPEPKPEVLKDTASTVTAYAKKKTQFGLESRKVAKIQTLVESQAITNGLVSSHPDSINPARVWAYGKPKTKEPTESLLQKLPSVTVDANGNVGNAGAPMAANTPAKNSTVAIGVDRKQFYSNNVVSNNFKPSGPSNTQANMLNNNMVVANIGAQEKFEGFVLDDKNKPLGSALVYAGKRKQMAVTDSSGYFRFNTSDTQLAVQISSVGYEAKQVQLKNNSLNYIIVNPLTASLSAVEVVEFGRSNGLAKRLPADSIIPEGGWPSFRDYVYKRLHKEAEMDTTGADIVITGSVEIEFTVDENGFARDARITKSLDKKIDAKALEMVQQWPRWIAGSKNKKANVVIQY